MNELIARNDNKITIHFNIGKIGLKNKSVIGLAWRMPEDWGEPQFQHP
jgi:hypothetical protein